MAYNKAFKKEKIPIDGKIYTSYACIGNDKAPSNIIRLAVNIATELNKREFTLRISPANPISLAVEKVSTKTEKCLPWSGFGDREDFDYKTTTPAKAIACRFQPNLARLKPSIHAIVGHYVHLILGKDLHSPIRFLVCWSADGVESLQDKTFKTGSIGVAIAIASWINIPIFNLCNTNSADRLKTYLSGYNTKFTEGDFHPSIFDFNRKEEI